MFVVKKENAPGQQVIRATQCTGSWYPFHPRGDARRGNFGEVGVLTVRRIDEKRAATPQIPFFNRLKNKKPPEANNGPPAAFISSAPPLLT